MGFFVIKAIIIIIINNSNNFFFFTIKLLKPSRINPKQGWNVTKCSVEIITLSNIKKETLETNLYLKTKKKKLLRFNKTTVGSGEIIIRKEWNFAQNEMRFLLTDSKNNKVSIVSQSYSQLGNSNCK